MCTCPPFPSIMGNSMAWHIIKTTSFSRTLLVLSLCALYVLFCCSCLFCQHKPVCHTCILTHPYIIHPLPTHVLCKLCDCSYVLFYMYLTCMQTYTDCPSFRPCRLYADYSSISTTQLWLPVWCVYACLWGCKPLPVTSLDVLISSLFSPLIHPAGTHMQSCNKCSPCPGNSFTNKTNKEYICHDCFRDCRAGIAVNFISVEKKWYAA